MQNNLRGAEIERVKLLHKVDMERIDDEFIEKDRKHQMLEEDLKSRQQTEDVYRKIDSDRNYKAVVDIANLTQRMNALE